MSQSIGSSIGYSRKRLKRLKRPSLGLKRPILITSTCDQVAVLTTFIKNGFQQNLKTGADFLDLTAAYDTVWHTGLLYKLSKSMPYWFTRLVGLLLRDRRFRVHMGNDTSSWRPQRNGLPQGSSDIPVLKIISVLVSIKFFRNNFSSVSVSVFTSFQ